MRGILVFNTAPDLAFAHGDEEFRSFLYRRAIKDGLLMSNNSNEFYDQFFQNAIVQLFAPLIASQQYMETKNPYRSIKFQSGLIFVFELKQNLIYIGINRHKTESETFIRRKLNLLHRIVQFFHGPVIDDIKPKISANIERQWNQLSSIIDTWYEAVQDEQCFLVEAVERLHVTPDLSAKTIELLESAIAMFRNSGDKFAVHGLIIARTNLLSLFSSRQASELQAYDVLMITLLLQDLFECRTSLEDLMAKPTVKPDTNWKEMFSKINLEENNDITEEDSDSEQEYFSASSDSDTEEKERKTAAASIPRRKSSTYNEQKDYCCKTVYLHTQYCKYTPHTLHCMEIYPGLTLVLISEITRSKQIGTLCQLFSIISDILSETPSGGKYRPERMEGIIKKLLEALKKFKGQTQRISNDIQKNWDYCKNNGLNQWLEGGCVTRLSMGLESSVKQLDQVLKKLFVRLSMASVEVPESVVNAVRQSFIDRLEDYRAFLAVKAQRNITMTSYIENFPGLVHFIYVDRKHDHVIAPSINVVQGLEGPMDATTYIKNKVWELARWCQDKLEQGYIAATKLEGDYYYSYYLWFEDISGNPLIVQKGYTAGSIEGPPGMISSRFYRKLIRHCFPQAAQRSVHCYELMCLHMGVVPPDFTLNHCRALAVSLWESSGEINSMLNLL